MNFSISLEQLLGIFPNALVEGSTNQKSLKAISSLERAMPGDISFLGNSKYKSLVPVSKASIILLPKSYKNPPENNQVFLKVDEPSRCLASLCRYLEKAFLPPREKKNTLFGLD